MLWILCLGGQRMRWREGTVLRSLGAAARRAVTTPMPRLTRLAWLGAEAPSACVHWGGGRRSIYHQVGLDKVGEGKHRLPVFDGRSVLDGTVDVRLDKVLDEHGVCVLGTFAICLLPPALPALPRQFVLGLTEIGRLRLLAGVDRRAPRLGEGDFFSVS